MNARYPLCLSASLAALAFSLSVHAQTTVSGNITDSRNGRPLNAVTVSIGGSSEGAFSDARGHFSLTGRQPLPWTLIFSSVGFNSDTVILREATPSLEIKLTPADILGQEVVVSASRVPENILESPVSIEQLTLNDIRRTPSANYYDMLAELKGVDVVTSGLLFTTITTRGFAASGNTGMIQLVDGMDNQAPGLNFSLGNIIGISELDIAKIELLPGASSALYGSGGTNGIVLMTSKDPFQYQGLSLLVKEGIMHAGDEEHDATPYGEYMLRYAKAFNNKFAFKVNASYVKAYDWIASDTRNYDKENFRSKTGSRSTDPAYDGVNIYGDETQANMQTVAQGVVAAGTQQFVAQYHAGTGTDPSPAQIDAFLSTNARTAPFYLGLKSGAIPDQDVSRTGFAEKSLMDYDTYNLKLNGMLQYKITPSLTATAEGNWATGTTIYTGSDRYSLKNFNIGQYKLELTGKNFMLRAYTTQEDAGEAYNASILGILMNESWKPSQDWFPQYVAAYWQAETAGASPEQAHAAARGFADTGMPLPGTALFDRIKDSVRNKPIPQGALFTDKSSLYQYEGFYNFSSLVKIFDLQAGVNYRRYRLNSQGTLFDEQGGKLTVDEYGLFTQVSKKLLRDKLKLTGSIRYDKNENFEGKWTPRIAGVFTVAPENNIRLSYQTAYKLPTNQDQFIDLNLGRARLIGGLPRFISKYDLNDNPGFLVDNVLEYGDAFNAAYAQNVQAGDPPQVAAYKAAVAAEKILKPYHFKPFKPESVQSFEIGYRGVIHQKLLIDAYAYLSNYTDFIGSIFLLQAKNGPQQINPADPTLYYGPQLGDEQQRNTYQTKVNSPGTIKTFGWALGSEYLLPGDFRIHGNVSYNKLQDAPAGFFTQFNTPSYRVNAGVGNDAVYKGFGFSLNWRYQSAFLYEGSFAVGNVPAVNTLDAQVTCRIPKYKVMVKAGGTNLLNHYYRNAFGNPDMGGLYYLAIGYNVF